MKKYFLLSLLVFSLLLVPAAQVYAQTDLSQDIATKSGYGSVTGSTLSETVGKIIKIVLGFWELCF